MKLKVVSKKILAFVLCFVMLISCWVFAAPAAVAEDFTGKYDVRISIEVVKRGYFDAAYQGIGGEKQATAGVSIMYKDKNGAAEEGVEYDWDLGTKGLNYADVVGSYTLTAEGIGFPYILSCYACGKTLSTEANTEKAYEVQKMEVKASGNDDEAYVTLWEGAIRVNTKIRGYGGYIDSTGYVTGWDNGLMNADEGSTTNSDNYITPESKYGWTDKMPHAESLVATAQENCWPNENALSIENNESVFEVGDLTCYDQYGAVITNPTRMVYGINNYDYASYGLEQSDLQMNTQGVISCAGDSYIAGDAADHTATVEATCFFGSVKVENETTAATAQLTFDQTIHYPEREVTWKYKLSTDELDSTTWGEVTSNALFGNTLTDADYPGEGATRNYYVQNHHYTGGTFDDFQVLADTTVEMEGYTGGNHSMSIATPIENDDAKHNLSCACGYTVTRVHNFDNGEITKPATCKEAGVFTRTCNDCGYKIESEIEKIKNHTWDAGVITTEPTCFADGEKTVTCSVCGETKTQPVSQLTHDIELKTTAPSNDSDGCIYYECKYCHSCWATVYDAVSGEYDLEDEDVFFESPAALMAAQGGNLPAPVFNIFTDSDIGYSYSTRGASLRYVFDKVPYSQPLRFTGSVKVPEGVSFQIGSGESNVVLDAGYVYSQTGYIENDISRLVVQSGDRKIAQLSIAAKNAENGVFTGHNWGGLTAHEEADGVHLTFNIVIAVDRDNWNKDYCVRPYITYKVGDYEVTVYDDVFSSRSVKTVASAVVNNASESESARNYCNTLLEIIGE